MAVLLLLMIGTPLLSFYVAVALLLPLLPYVSFTRAVNVREMREELAAARRSSSSVRFSFVVTLKDTLVRSIDPSSVT